MMVVERNIPVGQVGNGEGSLKMVSIGKGLVFFSEKLGRGGEEF